MTADNASYASTRLTIRVPLKIRKRGGRKVVEVPRGLATEPRRSDADSTLIKAIARAYRWQRMLEEGTYATMRELANAENISPSYISRLLRLTLIAPNLVQEILQGGSPDNCGAGGNVGSSWCEQIAGTPQRL